METICMILIYVLPAVPALVLVITELLPEKKQNPVNYNKIVDSILHKDYAKKIHQ